MKIKKIKIKSYGLLKFYLLKHRCYRKLFGLKFDRLLPYFKQILNIIYKYHIANKTILFVGFPVLKNKKLLLEQKTSKHIFLPNFLSLNGLLSNKISVLSTLKKKTSNIFFKKFQTPDLIIFFNVGSNKSNFIKEISKLNIPIVSFESKHFKTKTKFTYGIPDSIFKKSFRNFSFFLIHSIIKKK